MLSLRELNKQPILDERDVVFRMVVSYLEQVLTEGEEIFVATGTAFDGKGGISDYKCFYYCCRIPLPKRKAEIAAHGAGYLLYAFTVYVPDPLRRDNLSVQIQPAADRDNIKTFKLANPDNASEIQAFIKHIFDILKREQHPGHIW